MTGIRIGPPAAAAGRWRGTTRPRSGRALIAAGTGALLLVAGAAPARAADDSDVLLRIQDRRITESSGLAASVLHPGVYWTHNDSDDAARLYAIGSDGETKATITLQGVEARDWEAVAIGRDGEGRPAVFVGDIGDNLKGAWDEVWIHRFTEPATLADATVKPVKYRVRYEDGPRDAEAMLIDPRTGKVYIASKEGDGGLYEQPETLSPSRVNTFRRIADAGSTVTDGAFSPDGSRFVLRAYFSATVFSAPGEKAGKVDVPLQRQGESVTWSPDGRSLLFGSEGKGSQIWKVGLSGDRLPDSVRAEDAASTGDGRGTAASGSARADGGDGDDGDGVSDAAKTYGPGFLAVLGLVGLFFAYRRLGRRRG